jgi:hypothetical protein
MRKMFRPLRSSPRRGAIPFVRPMVSGRLRQRV